MHIKSSVSSVERVLKRFPRVCVYISDPLTKTFLHTHLVHVYSYFNESRSVGATNIASNQITPHDVENDSDRISLNSYIAHAYQSIFFVTTFGNKVVTSTFSCLKVCCVALLVTV